MISPPADVPRVSDGVLRALFRVRREERGLLALAFSYFFFLLTSYYVLRPIRDEVGVTGGVDNLPWLFLGTLGATMAISPLFSSLVAKLPRRRFVAWSYRALALCLVFFFLLLRELPDDGQLWAGRVFFVWLSVFNVFAVSLFWAVMADIFRTGQARRLYGIIGAGGTLGGITGGLLTGWLAPWTGNPALLLISAAMLEIALQCMFALVRQASLHQAVQRDVDRITIGGSVWAGITAVLRSRYLLGICGFLLLPSLGSALLYFLQAKIVSAEIADRALRTAYFARIDVWVNVLTLIIQLGLTGRLFERLGIGLMLALLPTLSLVGFAMLGFAPVLAAVIAFQTMRRAMQFALTGPAREALYIPLSREEKYKAKNLIDTFVFRFGDQMGAWSYTGFTMLGFGISGIAFAAIPLSALWLLLALWLGRRNAVLRRSENPYRSEPILSAASE